MTISEEIKKILTKESEDGVLRIKDFTDHFGSRSSAFIIVLLSLPIALPFTPPGLNTPIALICIFLSFNLILDRKGSNLPKWLENKSLPFSPKGKFFGSMTKLLEWIEKVIKPRLSWVIESKYSQSLLGLGVLCASVVMLIPMPGVNSISSMLVLLTSIGIVTKDGFIAFLSAISSVLLLVITVSLIIFLFYFGINFVNFDITEPVKDFIKGLFK